MWNFVIGAIVILCVALITPLWVCTVKQNHVLVLTKFGKFSRCLTAGLHVKSPFELRFSNCSLQVQSTTEKLQAVTKDQANVKFKMMLVFAVKDSDHETIKNAVFKFENFNMFLETLLGLVESEIRTDVAKYTQEQILGIREELSGAVMARMTAQVNDWGYDLHNLQITDIIFDKGIMESMSKVVEAQNKMKAAENEGKATYIEQTKIAEAEGKALEIRAEAEKKAMLLRGEGLAAFREAITEGLSVSMEKFKDMDVDPTILVQYMYMETMKDVAEKGTGHLVFMDNGAGAATRMIQQLKGVNYADDSVGASIS